MKNALPMRDRCSPPSAPEATEGERSEPEGAGRALATPDPEVPEKAKSRRFPAEYNLRILRLADSCTDPDGPVRLLRKEGLYASNPTTWRRPRDHGFCKASNRSTAEASQVNPIRCCRNSSDFTRKKHA
jgi:hypothetical protein